MPKPEIIDIPLFQDDRGYVYCAMDNLIDKGIKRTYVVENFSMGLLRAWHGHKKADTYMHVISGAAKVAALNMDDYRDVTINVLTARKPQLFYVPAGYYNGAMSLEDNTKIFVYSTLTFQQVKDDDVRMSHKIQKGIWEVKFR